MKKNTQPLFNDEAILLHHSLQKILRTYVVQKLLFVIEVEDEI